MAIDQKETLDTNSTTEPPPEETDLNSTIEPPQEVVNPNSTTKPPPVLLIPGLSDDDATNILARLPRWHHPVLSILSKRIKSLLSSPEFYTTRSLLNTTQKLIYIQSTRRWKPNKWFVVHRRPIKKDGKEELVLGPIPQAPIPKELRWLPPSVLGQKIYILPCCLTTNTGVKANYSSDVWVLDCRFNTWDKAPSMVVPRHSARVGVIDGKLYVVGGKMRTPYSETGASHLAEVFDPVIGIWELIPVPFEFQENIKTVVVSSCFAEGGRIRASCKAGTIVFDPRTNLWELESSLENSGFIMEGFEDWKEVFPGLSKLIMDVNTGGRKFLVWEKIDRSLWCAEFELNKSEEENCGRKLLWADKIPSLKRDKQTSFKAMLVSL